MVSIDKVNSDNCYRFVLSPNCSIARREVITLDRERIRVEKGVQQVDQSWEFQTPWIRIVDERYAGSIPRRRLAISMHGESVEIGSFLAKSEKDELAFQLKDCIIRV